MASQDDDPTFDPPPPGAPLAPGQPIQNPPLQPLPPPDPILTGATFNTASKPWAAILGNLTPSPPGTNQISDPTLGLSVQNATAPSLSIRSDVLWGSTFSTSRNATVFDAALTTADIGDQQHTATFGLSIPTSGPLVAAGGLKFSDVRQRFGVIPDASTPQLQIFIQTVDSTNLLTLSPDLSPTTRNALWLGPVENSYAATVAMRFNVSQSTALADITSFLLRETGLSLNVNQLKPVIDFTRTVFYRTNQNAPTGSPTTLVVSSTYSMTVSIQLLGFELSAIFDPSQMTVYLTNPQGQVVGGSIFSRLASAISGKSAYWADSDIKSSSLPDSSGSGPFNKLLSGIDLWYITVRRPVIGITPSQNPGEPGNPAYGNAYWLIRFVCEWNVGASNQPLLLSLEYDSRIDLFAGQLIFASDVPSDLDRRLPVFRWQDDLPAATKAKLAASPGGLQPLNLYRLFTDSGQPPKQVPSQLVAAKISYQKGTEPGSAVISILGSVVSTTAITRSAKAAPSGFSWDKMTVDAVITSGSAVTTEINLYASFSLNPPPGSVYSPVFMNVALSYSTGGSWLLDGQVQNVPAGLLYDFFDDDAKSKNATGILGNLSLRSLEVLYTYEPGGDATSFLITASIVLGDLELDLVYQYASALVPDGGKTAAQIAWANPGSQPAGVSAVTLTGSGSSKQAQWAFEASLGARTPNATLGSVINSISSNAVSLPKFVSSIGIKQAQGAGPPAVEFFLDHKNAGLALVLWVALGDFDLTFASIPVAASAGGGSPQLLTGTRRLLRITCEQIPVLSSIALLKELPQPFDKLLYLWIDDASGTGIAQTELDGINGVLKDAALPPILVKATNTAGNLPAIQAGHHFMVLNNGTMILDHNFSNQNSTSTSTPPPASGNPGGAAAGGQGPDPAPSKGAMDKTLPFISITGVSLQFTHGAIMLILDATLTLGPIQFEAIGFSIALDLTQIDLGNLSHTPLSAIQFGLHGLSVKLDQPPLLIAGVFIHETGPIGNNQTAEVYKGGIGLGFEAWQFLAVGEYAIVTITSPPPGGQYKSVFVFAKLDGPLFTIGFANIQGVRLGFGYNSLIRQPTAISEVPSFPLLAGAGSGSQNDPVAVLLALTTPPSSGGDAWVTPKEKAYWLAAGATLTAFGILNITAVLVVALHDGGAVIGVFADAKAQMPPDVDQSETLVYVEIALLAELDTIQGFFTVQAALAPSSHLLVPACRLTGGFALMNWFSPNPNAGDFVLTIGGYHPAYTPPAYYPPAPPRLGISFTLGNGVVSVIGESYFALTPKVVMGGGALKLSLDVGPVSAWLTIALDVLIQFKPFHYTADLRVSVGCAIDIKVWFVHVRISVSVGAALHITGPDDFGGTAEVDFYIVSFTIHFGSDTKIPDPLTLPQFFDLVQTPGPATQPPADSEAKDPFQTRHVYTLVSGILPTPPKPAAGPSSGVPSSGAGSTWNVKSGTFSFSISTPFAILTAAVVNDVDTSVNPPRPSSYTILPLDNGSTTPTPLLAKPMHLTPTTPLLSGLIIAVYSLADPNAPALVPDFGGTVRVRPLPAALWGAYDPASDPALVKTPADLTVGSGATINLGAGVTITRPVPFLPPVYVADFDPTAAMRTMVGPYPLLDVAPAIQSAHLPDTTAYPALDPTARWKSAGRDWEQAADGAQAVLGGQMQDGVQSEGVLSILASSLGWDVRAPGTEGATGVDGRSEWMLDGKTPRRLLEGLDRWYAVLPRFEVAV